MEKKRINILLNKPTEATQADIDLVEKEIGKYPHAQILHALLAKILFHLNRPDKNEKLTRAAIYSSDRSILKRIILEKGYFGRIKKIVPFQDLPKFAIEEEFTKPKAIKTIQNDDYDSLSIFAEVLKNLKELKALRQQFQFLELNEPLSESEVKESPETPPTEEISNEPIKEASVVKEPSNPSITKKEIKKPVTKKTEAKKKKLEEIAQKDELLDSQVNVFFLKEIEKSKESLESKPSDRHLVQSEIIERFIEEQPSIGSLKKEADRSNEEVNRDLAEKSTKFGDDLVSENLAIILLKQGKKERAIDIYKKLIWKLPQKKAYFAARIEEINK